MVDIATITAGMALAKTGFDTLRAAIGLAKDVKSTLPEGDEKEAVGKALEEADRQIRLGEAQIAKALGFPLANVSFHRLQCC